MSLTKALENIEKAKNEWIQKEPKRDPEKMNKHGYRGVTYIENKKKYDKRYVARIKVKGKRFHLGSFKTAKEAANAYQEALKIIK